VASVGFVPPEPVASGRRAVDHGRVDPERNAAAAATGDDLYRRGVATLLAAWERYASAADGAAVRRLPGATAAVFPRGPESAVYNNAVLDGGLDAPAAGPAVDAVHDAYARAGVARYALWVHEGDGAARRLLRGRGYAVRETTRAMGMDLAAAVPRLPAGVDLAPADWATYLDLLTAMGAPDGLLREADPAAFQVVTGRLGGRAVAVAMSHDHDGDCGIYNVATLGHARRRGFATALTAVLLRDAAVRGCRTATLQATGMAERLYAALGFRDLGRIVEYGPP
jgi:ribosomal protein S18 acetylase RimI-like enzyme